MNWRWLLILPTLWACQDLAECGVSDFSQELYIQVFDSATLETRDTAVFNEVVILLPNSSGGSNSGAILGDTLFGSAALPLDLPQTSTTFLFTTDSIIYDLELSYKVITTIENPECDPVLRVKQLQASSTTIDSIAVRVFELTKNFSPHVEIYL